MHDKKLQVWQAKQDAESSAVAFTTKRDALESKIRTKTQADPGTLGGGRRQSAGEDYASSPHDASADLVNVTKRRSAAVKALTNFEERIEDQKKLAETYRKWLDVVSAQQRTVIHRGLTGLAVSIYLVDRIFFDSWLTSS
jgi:hypothetical protein